MQIQLTQIEIITALKQYISQQGISLAGKEVGIKFTAGRKETGISADIDIREGDYDIPGFTTADPEPLHLVQVPEGSFDGVSPQTEESDAPQESPAVAKATTSLFN